MWASHGWQVIALFALYGVFYLEPERRATAVGAYNVVTGVLYLPASLVAGALWTLDPRWAFGLATLLTLAAIALVGWKQPASANRPSNGAVPSSPP
ncbi:MAG TPA: hypothetical protein VET87_11945 [Rubrivivax sp.]|nr:hypothetical protein [Rubrivivax sp.]